MVPSGGRIVDHLGTHQHLAVDLELRAGADGSLVVTSHGQRFSEGPVTFAFPLLFSGTAVPRESWDADRDAFRVDLNVGNRVVGFLLGYTGSCTCRYVPATDATRAQARPARAPRLRATGGFSRAKPVLTAIGFRRTAARRGSAPHREEPP